MADEDIELAPEAGKGSKLKLISLLLGGVLVVAGATVGALVATGLVSFGGPETVAEAGEAAEAEDAPPLEEAVYVALDPAFTVNFGGTEAGARYLQLSVEAMTRDGDIEYVIKRHLPAIRSDLMLLFGSKTAEELKSSEGKQTLADETLASIQAIVKRESGREGVEAVYFTNFVMQ